MTDPQLIEEQLNTTLPDTLHGLLKIALDDLELCEADPDYHINMLCWHYHDEVEPGQQEEPKCFVCLAGSVLAKTCGVPKDFNLYIGTLDNSLTAKKLNAIDWLRDGDVKGAYQRLHGTVNRTEGNGHVLIDFNRCIKPYTVDPILFKTQLRALVTVLEEAGI